MTELSWGLIGELTKNQSCRPKPADEPGQCPVCASPVTTRPYRKSERGWLLVYCFACKVEREIGC